MTVTFEWTPKKPPRRFDGKEPDFTNQSAVFGLISKTEHKVRDGNWLVGGCLSEVWHEKWFVEDEGWPTLNNMSRWLATNQNLYLAVYDLRTRIMTYDTFAIFSDDLIRWARGYTPMGAYELARAVHTVLGGNPLEWVDDAEKLAFAEEEVRKIKRVLDSHKSNSIKSMWAVLRSAGLISETGGGGRGPHKPPTTILEQVAASRDGIIEGAMFIPRRFERDRATENRWANYFNNKARRLGVTRDDVFRDLVEQAIRDEGGERGKAA